MTTCQYVRPDDDQPTRRRYCVLRAGHAGLHQDLDTRLSYRLPPEHPDFDPFYDATDIDLAAMIPPPAGGEPR